MISLGIAQNKAYDEMLSTWGDLTQIQVYGGGVSVSVSVGSTMISSDSGSSSEPAKLNDEMVESFKRWTMSLRLPRIWKGTASTGISPPA